MTRAGDDHEELERRAHRPARWVLVILGVVLLAMFAPLFILLDHAGSDSPAHVLIVVLGALFYSAKWLLGLWGLRRFDRLRADG